MRFFGVVSIIFTIIGAVNYAFSLPENAIQQLTIAATSLAIVIIPYCLARAVTELSKGDHKTKEKDILEKSLEYLNQGISELNEKASMGLMHAYSHTAMQDQLSDQEVDEIIGDLKKLQDKGIINVVELENAKIKLRKRTKMDIK